MDVAEISDADFVRKNFKILRELGSGAFGEVYKGFARDTKETVALKIIRKKYFKYCQNEVKADKLLRRIDQHENFVRLNRHFITERNLILEFELLEMNLDEYMFGARKPLSLYKIQLITRQLLMALSCLKCIGLVHGDIKPDNIMVAEHRHNNIKVKLIDFGLAFQVGNAPPGQARQAIDYRAPEVILGLPLNEALDMWSLGCVVAFMYLGSDLYSARDEFDRVRVMVQMQGQPDNKLLQSAIFTPKFFSFNDQSSSWHIRENCPWKPPINDAAGAMTCLDDIVTARPNTSENDDTRSFVNLLKQMLEVDPEKRISPNEALSHPFLKTRYFPSDNIAVEPRRAPYNNRVTNVTFNCSVPANEETTACVTKESKVRKTPKKVEQQTQQPAVHVKGASRTKADDSITVCIKEASLPEKMPKKAEQQGVLANVLSNVKPADAGCTTEDAGLKKTQKKTEQRAVYTQCKNEASKNPLEDSIPVHEKTAIFTSGESALGKTTKRFEHTAASNGATNTTGDNLLQGPCLGEESRLKKALKKAEQKPASDVKAAPNVKPDDSLPAHEETAVGTKHEPRAKKTQMKPNQRAKAGAVHGESDTKKESKSKKTQKEPKQKGKMPTIQEDTARRTKADGKTKKTEKKPKQKQKHVTIQEVPDESKPNKSHKKAKQQKCAAAQEETTKRDSRSKKTLKKPEQEGEGMKKHVKWASNFKMIASLGETEKKGKSNSKSTLFKKVRKFFSRLF